MAAVAGALGSGYANAVKSTAQGLWPLKGFEPTKVGFEPFLTSLSPADIVIGSFLALFQSGTPGRVDGDAILLLSREHLNRMSWVDGKFVPNEGAKQKLFSLPGGKNEMFSDPPQGDPSHPIGLTRVEGALATLSRELQEEAFPSRLMGQLIAHAHSGAMCVQPSISGTSGVAGSKVATLESIVFGAIGDHPNAREIEIARKNSVVTVFDGRSMTLKGCDGVEYRSYTARGLRMGILCGEVADWVGRSISWMCLQHSISVGKPIMSVSLSIAGCFSRSDEEGLRAVDVMAKVLFLDLIAKMRGAERQVEGGGRVLPTDVMRLASLVSTDPLPILTDRMDVLRIITGRLKAIRDFTEPQCASDSSGHLGTLTLLVWPDMTRGSKLSVKPVKRGTVKTVPFEITKEPIHFFRLHTSIGEYKWLELLFEWTHWGLFPTWDFSRRSLTTYFD